ncbi:MULTISPECIES: carbohydrate ABC transporter permease [Subtercola]|uniref:Sugar ABC transporter permease n=1 Tax=Subtercola vilae TaxID=2056433 RepID=A0A4T2C6P4_9MICO|nr:MULTISPECIES: sugar ABC transporter permease [Subtercola]MEA9984337.1 sugar ABC transporter permease [Subtercola sp. RTI3]TIH40095.1 sugar ABC transporter permease [Subtercola vilae]
MTTARLQRTRPFRPHGQLGGRTPLNGTFKRRATIVGFLAPALVILAAFVGWPMISALRLSFTDASGFGTPTFVGLDNYTRIFTDPEILHSMGNTAYYAVMFTPVSIAVALMLALAINSPRLPFRSFFRSTLFLPFIISLAVAAFAWSYLLDPQIGLLNYWLAAVGIHLGNVLQDPVLAMPTVVLVAVWKNFGFYMVIFLAGLQEIPTSLYEAAQLDGANGWRRFTNVTFPMLSNTMAFVVVVALIAALQAFDQIYVLTGGGPYRSTETIVMQIYQSGFKDLDLGFASALSYVLLIVTLLLSLVQFLFFGRRGEANNS